MANNEKEAAKKSASNVSEQRSRPPVARWAWTLAVVAAIAGVYAASVVDRHEQAKNHNLRTLEQTARAVERLVGNAESTFKSLSKQDYACEYLKRQKRLKLTQPPSCRDVKPVKVRSKTLTMDAETSALQLHGFYNKEKDEPDVVLEFRLDQVLYDAPFGDAFDSVMVADNRGRVIEQHRPAPSSPFKAPSELSARSPLGLRIDDLNKLPSANDSKNTAADYAKFEDSTSVAAVKAAGTSYYLMCQPLRLAVDQIEASEPPAGDSHAQAGGAMNWRLCGLISRDRSYRQALEVASPLVIAMFSAALLSVLAWPIFKVLTVAQRERVRFIDLYFVLLASTAIIMVATALLLNWESVFALRSHSEARLESLSQQIEDDLMAEFLGMHEQLREYDDILLRKHINDIEKHLKDKRTLEAPAELESKHLLVDSANRSQSEPAPAKEPLALGSPEHYPYFTSAFWMRPCDGRQLIKATVRSSNTPAVTLFKRAYFDAVKKRDLWQVDNERFFVQTFASITTGEFSAALSTESKLASPENSVLAAWSREELQELSYDCMGDIHSGIAAAISARPYSVIYPVLAPGVGFAILDEDGNAVFHSDERRATLENLLDDDGLGERLRAALVSAASVHFKADYRTRPHQIYVKPMSKLQSWTIVTFADDEILRTASLEVLARATILITVYLLLLTILTIGYMAVRRREVPRWLWPMCATSATDCAGLYNSVSLLLTVVVVVFIFALRWTSGDAMLLLSGTIPLLTLAAVIVGFWLFDRGSLSEAFVRIVSRWIIVSLVVGAFVWDSWSPFVDFGVFEGLLILGVVLASAIVSFWRPRWWTDSLYGYIRTSVLLWLIVAILPTYGFFKVAYESEMSVLATMERDFSEQAADRRADNVREYYRDIDFYSTDEREEFLSRLTQDCGRYNASLSGPFTTDESKVSLDNLWKAASRRQPIYNETTTYARYVESKHLTTNADTDQADPESNNASICNGAGRASPFVPPIESVQLGWRSFLFGIPSILLLWAWVVYGAQRLFFGRVDADNRLELKFDDVLTHKVCSHTIAIVASPIQYAQLAADNAHHHIVDLAMDELPAHLISPTSHIPVLCINVETVLQDSGKRAEIMAYLKALLKSDRRTVLIVSQQDISAVSLEGIFGNDVEMRTRLLPVLSRFTTRHVSVAGSCDGSIVGRHRLWSEPDKSWVGQEVNALCGLHDLLGSDFVDALEKLASRHDALESIVAAAEQYYNSLWESCSTDEKLVLVQLEQESVVNPKQIDAVRSLLNRGLLKKDHSLRLINESFGFYVSRAADPEQIRRWEKIAGPQWANKRAVLLGTVFVILLFLWFTQRDVVETWIAYLGAVAVALSGILRILSSFRGSSPGSA